MELIVVFAVIFVIMAFAVFGRRTPQYPPRQPHHPHYPHTPYQQGQHPPYNVTDDYPYQYQYPPQAGQYPPNAYQGYQQQPYGPPQHPPYHDPRHRHRDDSGNSLTVLALAVMIALAVVIVMRNDKPSASSKDITITGQPPAASIPPATPPSSAALPQQPNQLLEPRATPPPLQTAPVLPNVQPPGAALQPFYGIYLKKYAHESEAFRLKNGFKSWDIQITLMPDGHYLCYIPYGEASLAGMAAKEINQRIADFKPYGIVTERPVVDLNRYCPGGMIRINNDPVCQCGTVQ